MLSIFAIFAYFACFAFTSLFTGEGYDISNHETTIYQQISSDNRIVQTSARAYDADRRAT